MDGQTDSQFVPRGKENPCRRGWAYNGVKRTCITGVVSIGATVENKIYRVPGNYIGGQVKLLPCRVAVGQGKIDKDRRVLSYRDPYPVAPRAYSARVKRTAGYPDVLG
jgi:hypothetical protein